MAENYRTKSTTNAELDVLDTIKSVLDSMILFTRDVALRVAERQKELSRSACMSSIYGKVAAQGNEDLKTGIKFAKTQKKDAYYDTRIHI